MIRTKYNPAKSHFEQYLEYYEHKGNPDIELEEMREILKSVLADVMPLDHPKYQDVLDEINHEVFRHKSFFDDGKKIYRIAEEFGRELQKVKLNNLTCKYLPKESLSCSIEFPITIAPLFFTNTNKTSHYRNCYVTFVVCDGSDPEEVAKGNIKKVSLVFPAYDSEDCYQGFFEYIDLVFRDEDQTLEEVIMKCEGASDTEVSKEGFDAIKYVINTLLYLNSGDPDLRHKKVSKSVGINIKNLDKWSRKNKHKAMLSSTLVGFDYMKERTYSVNSAPRRGFFRWQRHGKGNLEIKLIWVEDTTVHYKNLRG